MIGRTQDLDRSLLPIIPNRHAHIRLLLRRQRIPNVRNRLTNSSHPISSRRSPLFSRANFISLPLDANGRIIALMNSPQATTPVKKTAATARRGIVDNEATQRSPITAPIAISMGYAPPR